MKNISGLLLQIATVLFGVGVLAFLLWEPRVEGRNVHATTFEMYFQDPFLAFVYVGSTPFFVGIVRAFRWFGHVRRNPVCSASTVDSLRGIKRCAIGLMDVVAVGLLIILVFGDREDRPAGVFMGLLIILAASAVALATAGFARVLESRRRLVEGRVGC